MITVPLYTLTAPELRGILWNLADRLCLAPDDAEASVRAVLQDVELRHGLPPLPGRTGPSYLDGCIDAAVVNLRRPYLAPGMTEVCGACGGQYRDAAALGDHRRDAHGEAR